MTATVEESLKLLQEGEVARAVALCETLRQDPAHECDALHLLGVAAAHEGDAERALRLMGEAVQKDPDNDERRFNLGALALDVGAFEVAIEHLSWAAAHNPSDPACQTLLGNALSKEGRHAEAVAAQERAVALASTHAGLWGNLAGAYLAWGKLEAAETGYRHAIQLGPNDPELYYNLGGALVRQGKNAEAIGCFELVLGLDPQHGRARTSLGAVMRGMGQLELGLKQLERAYETAAEDCDVRFNLGLAYLSMGKWAEGWPLYEARRERMPQLGREGFGVPWDGSSAPGEKLVIEREQGLGDSLMFARFLSAARDRVGSVELRTQERLVPFLKESLRVEGVEIVPFEVEPFSGLYAPMMSLAHLVDAGADLRAADVPYLSASPERIERWRAKLGPSDKLRVGLVWQGNPGFPHDAQRSVALEQLAPLLSLTEFEIICLQQVHGLEQLDALPSELRPRRLEGVDADGAFVDTAALMSLMDHVVTIDSACVHLAGGLGVQTSLLLHHSPDWRWGQGSEAWYPSVTEYRQSRPGSWKEPVERLTAHLAERARRSVG